MAFITRGLSGVKDAMQAIVDDSTIDVTPVTFTTATVGGVKQVSVNWGTITGVWDQVSATIPAGSLVINTVDVASPTTYYIFINATSGTPVVEASTTSPITNPAVDEYSVIGVIRFKSVSDVATVYFSKQPAQDGIYELCHNLKEDVMFFDPVWLSGIELSATTGGVLTSTSGYVRFPGNEPRVQAAVTGANGKITLENETVVDGTDGIITYSNGDAIGVGEWHKILLGVLRDRLGANTSKYIAVRQGKPTAAYMSSADAIADAEGKAATAFPTAYKAAVTPIAYIVTAVGAYATAGFTIIDIRATGIPAQGGSAPVQTSHHALVDLTNYDDHTQYVHVDGSHALTGHWNAGSKNITTTGALSGSTLVSTLADGGAAPMTITSGTVVTNLNADKVDGHNAAEFVHVNGDSTMTGALAMGSKSITGADDVGCATLTATGNAKALTLQSTEVTNAPITVASAKVCTNLNADKVDGKDAADFLLLAGGTMTGAIAMGSKSITGADDVGCATLTASGNAKALTLQSTEAVLAPITVASTAVVTNLNADTVDAIHGTDLLKKDGTVAMTGNLNLNSKSITSANDVGTATLTASGLAKALTFESTQTTGTAPFVVASATKVTTLNADQVDGKDSTAFLLLDGTQAMTGALDMGAKAITNAGAITSAGLAKAVTFESTQTTGTAPFAVASATKVTTLNADQVDGKDSTDFLLLDGTQAMTGGLNMGSKAITSAAGVGTTTLTASGLAKALTFESTEVTNAPIAVASAKVCTNLNADKLDGLDDTAFLKADGTVTLTGNMAVGSGITIDGVDIGAHAVNANAHHNAVTLDVNADTVLSLSTQAIGLDTQTASYAFMGPAAGASAAVPTFRAIAPGDILRSEGVLTLTDGQNNNVTLTDGVDVYTVTGPTNAFGIAGMTGGYAGRTVVIQNTIAKNMTAYHQNAGSTTTNRIICPGTLADTATTSYGCMTFVYMGTTQRWLLTSIIA